MTNGIDIVVVDDDPTVLEGLQMRLEKAGHRVRTGANGEEAMAVVGASAPDLLITDIFMPVREGIETIIQARKAKPELKILAISGAGQTGSLSYLKVARDLGADAVLAKPFTTQQLLEAVEELFSDNSSATSQ